MKPKPTIIYCLKNPLDRNRVFYVGRTVLKLNIRLLGHIHKPSSKRMSDAIKAIIEAGKKPIIHELERCVGYLQPMQRERYWFNHYNKRKYKLLNAPFSRKKTAANDRVYW